MSDSKRVKERTNEKRKENKWMKVMQWKSITTKIKSEKNEKKTNTEKNIKQSKKKSVERKKRYNEWI